MTTKICDRCGAEIREYPWQAMTFPTYSVVKVDMKMDGAVPVDLCRKCQDKFTEWLKGNSGDGPTYAKLKLRGENPLRCYGDYFDGAKYVVIDTCAKNDTRDYGAYWYEGEDNENRT